MRSIQRVLSSLLVFLLFTAIPAEATSLEDLILDLEKQYTVLPDLSQAFGSDGISQGEVIAQGIISGSGILYKDNGSGFNAADLVLLLQGFSASAQVIAAHTATLYEKGRLRVLILPQIVPGKTLVITSAASSAGMTVSPSPTLTPAPTPVHTSSPALGVPTDEDAVAVMQIGSERISLPLAETLVSDIYTEASFSDGIRHLILGLPTVVSVGDVISPEYVLTQSECYPYITYIDENGAEWYALAWNEPISVMDDSSILYNIKMEPGDLADYRIDFSLVSSDALKGAFSATLARTDAPENTLDLSGTFRFERVQP